MILFWIFFSGQPAHSGASSTHGSSHIKSLLMNLPWTDPHGTTRGFHTDMDADDSMQSFDDDDGDMMFSNPTKMVANSFVLGKGKAENLEFDWVITEWSACSQTCGGTGFQVHFSFIELLNSTVILYLIYKIHRLDQNMKTLR